MADSVSGIIISNRKLTEKGPDKTILFDSDSVHSSHTFLPELWSTFPLPCYSELQDSAEPGPSELPSQAFEGSSMNY